MPVLSFAIFGGSASFDYEYDRQEIDTCMLFLGEFGNTLLEIAKIRKIPRAKLILLNYNYLCIAKDAGKFLFLFIDTSGDNFIKYYDLQKEGFIDESQLKNELESEVGKVDFSFMVSNSDVINQNKIEIQHLVDKALQLNSQLLQNELNNPKVFISYTHDNDEHKNWVLQLATRLRANSVDILLDQWNRLGSNLISFMEQGLSKSHRVICICSENYVIKANQGIGGAGYEKQIMASELLKDQNTDWVIPLIRNNPQKKVPIFLSGKLYIDFTDDNFQESRYIELARELVDEPLLPIKAIKLFDPNNIDREIFKNLKKFYNFRSKVVHGNAKLDVKIATPLIDYAEGVLQKIIVRMIELNQKYTYIAIDTALSESIYISKPIEELLNMPAKPLV